MSTEGHPAMLTCTCLTQPKLDDLLDFSVETNSSLVFGLTYAEDINSTRTKLLLDYLHTRAGGFQMYVHRTRTISPYNCMILLLLLLHHLLLLLLFHYCAHYYV